MMITTIYVRIAQHIAQWRTATQPIDLDYEKPIEHPRKLASWILLVAGIALLGEMGLSYKQLKHEQKIIVQKRQPLAPQIAQRQNKATYNFSAKDFETAQQIIKRLATPWNELFLGLESANFKEIAILSVEPDMQNGLIHISGEAKDYASVLTLIARLRSTQPFSEVFLLHREIKLSDPERPVVFILSMKWNRPE